MDGEVFQAFLEPELDSTGVISPSPLPLLPWKDGRRLEGFDDEAMLPPNEPPKLLPGPPPGGPSQAIDEGDSPSGDDVPLLLVEAVLFVEVPPLEPLYFGFQPLLPLLPLRPFV